MFFVDTVIVGVWVVVVAGIVVVVVKCVEIYTCTEQKYFQRFQLFRAHSEFRSASRAFIWLNRYFPNLPDMAEH